MEVPGNDGSISFLHTKCSPNSDYTVHISVYRHPTNTNHYLGWNSNHPISATKTVINTLVYSAKNVCSTSEILFKEMDHLHGVLLKNNYPDWVIKEFEKKQITPIINSDIGLEKNIFISVLYIPGLSGEFRRIF